MDALRVLLLSLMLGQNVSNADLTEKAFLPAEIPIVAEVNPAPTSPIIWDQAAQVTPAPIMPTETAAPTRPSGFPRNLRLGMKGEDVKRIQQLLSDLGYDVAVGGTFSALTEEAVQYFQYVNRLTVDGVVGPKTYQKLTSRSALGPSGTNIRTVLAYGMKGQDVMELQLRLGQLGYYDDIISGNYLKNTRKAVYTFQEAHGLIADGIAGADTLYLVFSQMAMQAPGHGGWTGSAGTGQKPPQGGQGSGGQRPPNSGSNSGQTGPSPSSYIRTLSKGISGADVTQLTTRLRELGFYPYNPTSQFDENVYWAVLTFQQFNKLPPDGIAGEVTLTRLYSGDAVKFSTSQQDEPRDATKQAPDATTTRTPDTESERRETKPQSTVENSDNTKDSTSFVESAATPSPTQGYNPWDKGNSEAEFVWPNPY